MVGVTGDFGAADHLPDLGHSTHRAQFHMGMLIGEYPEHFVSESLSDHADCVEIQERRNEICPRAASGAWLANAAPGLHDIILRNVLIYSPRNHRAASTA